MPNISADVLAGAPNLAAYIDNGDGTVTDSITNLMWQKAATSGLYTPEDAAQYCSTTISAMGLGGHNDWRLPSMIELVSIVDYGRPSPTIDPVFPMSATSALWSSTPGPASPSARWGVTFYFGLTFADIVGAMPQVRCVR